MLTRWAPFDLVDRTEREFDDLFRRAFGELGTRVANGNRAWAPALDVFSREGRLHVRLEMPGIDPENDVDIEIADGVLRITGERRREHEGEHDGYLRREMSYGRFERAVALPDGVDAGSVEAAYEAGILDVSFPIPRKEASKVKVQVNRQLGE